MAIYHLHVNTGTRQGGQSGGAKSDYINRAGQYDRDDLVYAASANMPVWAAEPGAYWQAADVYERVNGRLFKEIEAALPRELTPEQQRELVKAFVHAIVDSERLPYSIAIHSGEDESGEWNPHFHLIISERMNDNIPRAAGQWFKRYNPEDPVKGGARKTDSLKPQAWLERTRKLWADLANAALERAGHDARIDHRTLEAQGVERVPQIHLGPNVVAMERKGIRTDRGDRYREIAAIVERQAREDEERQRAEPASPWRGTPDGARSDEAPDGLAPTVVPAASLIYPDQQGGSPRQIAAALYRHLKDQVQRAGRSGIEFSGLTGEVQAQIERMAAEDGWGDRIRFCEADDNDLEGAMKRPPAPPVPGPKRGP